MRLQRGSTAIINIDVGTSLSAATVVLVVFERGVYRLEKNLSNGVTVSGSALSVELTETEALALPSDLVDVQVVAVVGGKRVQSDVVHCDVAATLVESEVMSSE